MRVAITNLLLVAFAAAASGQQRAVIVSYPNDTPQSVLDQAMAAIKETGGVITHEYNLIKGFAATASEQALESVQVFGTQNNVIIENDQEIHI